MDFAFPAWGLKAAGSFLGLCRRIGKLVFDRTHIGIEFEVEPESQADCARLKGPAGQLVFQIKTKSQTPVEIQKIEILYPSTLQLVTPDQSGFFSHGPSQNVAFPFKLEHTASFDLEPKTAAAFTVLGRFDEGILERRVLLRVTARAKHRTFLSYLSHGSPQITEKVAKVITAPELVAGLKIPPGETVMIFQPFLASGAATVVSGNGPMLVHEGFKDGTVKSSSVFIPKSE